MKLANKIASLAFAGALALAAAGNAMASDRTTNTLLGAGLGAAAGAIFSEGDPLFTLGGAAAGGVLGNVLTEDRRDNWRGNRHYRGKQWDNRGPRWRNVKHKNYRSHGRQNHRGHRHHR
ncbi:glycine zipper 2TM domain-containing protein [Allopusillimonas ginsengisoli]|uniref:glycine zipper 2TM domain-containing protein n=1 Tax=Allopusillimonas ginsengisoli TaxID=453575 RepID=UPI0010209F04|nr:glycine zipper 2TM domain-containing protein [Allopusillimonas ginsengisoli]TEA77800.1 hypothetical protein ERE07_12295 [Allopusillimonas ginsengisoli]